jgi:hypothetical protein
VAEPIDEVDEVEEIDEAPRPSRRRGKPNSDAAKWVRLALAWLPTAVGLSVLLGMFLAARASKPLADMLMLWAFGLGALTLGTTYFWALSIAIAQDPAARIGYVIPRWGMRHILAHREHMGEPFKALLIGMAFLVMGVVFQYLHYTPPQGW